ncbi:MAG: carbonic anhydrase family protein [Thiobacillus sp.]|nr:carbonic anhydrase family protein [Thiobacillus sp.]
MSVRPLSAVLLSCLSLAAWAETPHWAYEGAHGAAHWAEIDKSYSECKLGHAQSPIDIRTAKVDKNAPALEFAYQPKPLALVNNGHTVQVNEAGAGTLTIGGHVYQLAQFHFHTPSEERIKGKPYDLVAHFVHKDEAGKLAVVAVLFKVGKENTALKPVLDNMPIAAGPEHSVAGVSVNPADLLPARLGYYHFMGSLTTPPCSEGVSWYVLTTPVELSRAQLAEFRTLYQHNARPVQPLNGREVTERL